MSPLGCLKIRIAYPPDTCWKVYGSTCHCFSSIHSCWHYLIDPLYPLYSFVRLVCYPPCKASWDKPPTCIVIEAFYVWGTESQKCIYLMHTKAGILFPSFSVYIFPTALHYTSTWISKYIRLLLKPVKNHWYQTTEAYLSGSGWSENQSQHFRM